MGERWCTVSVTEPDGRRHSVDVLATSVFDAAHICIVHAKKNPQAGFPRLSLGTIFEVVIDGKVYRVEGKALQRWIVKERQERRGPRGHIFAQRPGLE
jgi:hypothetical protein